MNWNRCTFAQRETNLFRSNKILHSGTGILGKLFEFTSCFQHPEKPEKRNLKLYTNSMQFNTNLIGYRAFIKITKNNKNFLPNLISRNSFDIGEKRVVAKI